MLGLHGASGLLVALAALGHATMDAEQCAQRLPIVCKCSPSGSKCHCPAAFSSEAGCCDLGCGGCDDYCRTPAAVEVATDGGLMEHPHLPPPPPWTPPKYTSNLDRAACAAHADCASCVEDGCAWCSAFLACAPDARYECGRQEDHVSHNKLLNRFGNTCPTDEQVVVVEIRIPTVVLL